MKGGYFYLPFFMLCSRMLLAMGPSLKRRSRMERLGVKPCRSANTW